MFELIFGLVECTLIYCIAFLGKPIAAALSSLDRSSGLHISSFCCTVFKKEKLCLLYDVQEGASYGVHSANT